MPHAMFESVPIFSSLPDEERTELCNLASIETIPKGQVLAREGEQGDEIFALLEGVVDIEVKNAATRTILRTPDKKNAVTTLTKLHPGELFGEMVLLGRKRRVASVLANEKVTIAVWPVQKLFDLFQKKPAIGYRFMLALSCHLADRLESSNMVIRNQVKAVG